MVALQAGTIVTVPLDEACTTIKTVAVDGQLVRTARDIGISFAAPREAKINISKKFDIGSARS
jgi:post-segregation antitoxin (ccd killing protein)